jgi:glycine cleavage system H protein
VNQTLGAQNTEDARSRKKVATMTVLLVVAVILFFLALDWLNRRRDARDAALMPVPAPAGVKPIALRYPKGIFFAKSHTWLNLFPTGVVRLGVDDFIARLMKNPAIAFLKSTGDVIKRGEPLLQLNDGEHTLTIRSPISGNILRVNDELCDHPEGMHDALFYSGWAFSIKPESVRELRTFLMGDEPQSWIREELGRLRDFLAGVNPNAQMAPSFMQDGGISVEGALNGVDEQGWKRFESEFLAVE